jgi:2-polyprenyl-6-methoxyphenol hydroxylase-like FAD-dependent oxidoreductase
MPGHSTDNRNVIPGTLLPSERLRITVIGGGPVGLIFSSLISSIMTADQVRIRLYEDRWYVRQGRVEWKGSQQANRRREQVTTVQSRQYTLLPRPVFEYVFTRPAVRQLWPTGPDSVNQLPPLNIRISDLEDRLLDWIQDLPQIELHASRFAFEHDSGSLRGEHIVVICDGAGSKTRDPLEIFGQPDTEAFSRGGRRLQDVVLGLQVKSDLHPSAAVIWTVAQNRFLLNPGANGEGFLNMRLTDEEATEAYGVDPHQPNVTYPCTQSHPCFAEQRVELGRRVSVTGAVFKPSRLAPGRHRRSATASLKTSPALWSRILDGLRLFGVGRDDLKSVSSFTLSMAQRPRFTGVLFHQTSTGQAATIAALIGDAAIPVHFWPGRGLNTGIASAAALANTIKTEWRGRPFREAQFSAFEAMMAQLQFRNQLRGFYGSMRVDDQTGRVVPIRDVIGASYRYGSPSPTQHRINCELMAKRLSVIRDNLRGRLPEEPPSLEALISRLNLMSPETISALVASGPWDTYRSGGPEVDIGLSLDANIGWTDLARPAAGSGSATAVPVQRIA